MSELGMKEKGDEKSVCERSGTLGAEQGDKSLADSIQPEPLKWCKDCKFKDHGRYEEFPINSPCIGCIVMSDYTHYEPREIEVQREDLMEWRRVLVECINGIEPNDVALLNLLNKIEVLL